MLQMNVRFNYTLCGTTWFTCIPKIFYYSYFLVKYRLIFELSACNNLSE